MQINFFGLYMKKLIQEIFDRTNNRHQILYTLKLNILNGLITTQRQQTETIFINLLHSWLFVILTSSLQSIKSSSIFNIKNINNNENHFITIRRKNKLALILIQAWLCCHKQRI
ncbi:hypothetical protein pb186bvf_018217 [Paramecium bursaria]